MLSNSPIQQQLRVAREDLRRVGVVVDDSHLDVMTLSAERIENLEGVLRELSDWLPHVGDRSEYHAGYDSAREDVAAIAHQALEKSK